MHADLKDPFARWVVYSTDNDALAENIVDGGTGSSLGSHLALKTKEEAFSLPIGCSGSVSLVMEGDGVLCLAFLAV